MYTYRMNTQEIDTFVVQCTQALQNPSSVTDLYETIVNEPFKSKLQTTQLGLGIIVLLIRNEADGTLDRVALSKTERAESVREISVTRFEDIRIPLDAEQNVLIQAMERNDFKIVSDWKYLFVPVLTAQEARLNQAGAAIDCSVVYPLSGYPKGGAMIFSYFEPLSKLTNNHHRFMRAYSMTCAEALHRLEQLPA